MTLYVDIIFLENIVMNSIILFATAVILKTQIKIWRILISSIIGSIYAIVIYVSKIELYSNVFLKLILSVVIVLLCFFTFTNVYAESESNFFDLQAYSNIYKFENIIYCFDANFFR